MGRMALMTGLLASGMIAATLGAGAGPAGADSPRVTTPIGGGYETASLEGFVRAAMARDRDGDHRLDIVVVPSAYGDDPAERAENLELAARRTASIGAACEAMSEKPGGYTGCSATLAVLLDRADAMDPANARPFAHADAIYALGGDQGIAMHVLADTPAERAMARATRAGALFAGTSAGAAIQSCTMGNGPAEGLEAEQGLQRGSVVLWWCDDGDLERGLAFGSRRAFYDQHFYERGRFGRTLSSTFTADEHAGGRGPVSVGVDYATGVRSSGDVTLDGVFGPSSAAVIDTRTLRASHTWVGEPAVLSARRVLTHLLVPGAAYDLPTRTYSRDGATLPTPTPQPWAAPTFAGRGTLLLGGGDVGPDVAASFVAAAGAATATKDDRILVLSADTASSATATRYAQLVRKAGWPGSVRAVTYAARPARLPSLTGVRGVVLVAGDPSALTAPMRDPAYRAWVTLAALTSCAVLADGAMTAAMGERWAANPGVDDDTRADAAVAAFRAGDARWRRGLHLVPATLVPALTTDYRWGRLYDAVATRPQTIALGLTSGSALTVRGAGAVTSGSVVAADGRGATTWTASNGALGASGVVLDVFGPGERLGRR